MLGRAISFLVGIVVIGILLIWFGVLQNPFADSSTPKSAMDDLRFQLTYDKYKEHPELSANLHVAFVSSPGMPDRIAVAEKDGPYLGSVVWAVVETQRGESRLTGEVRTGGRSYRVCEFLSRTGPGATTTAERFYPINNDGNRFRNPDNIDPSPLQALLSGITAEQSALGKPDAPTATQVPASPALNRTAIKAVAVCLAPPGPAQR